MPWIRGAGRGLADIASLDSDTPFISAKSVRPFPLILLSGVTLALALLMPSGAPMVGAIGAGAGLVAAAVILWVVTVRDGFFAWRQRRRVVAMARVDPAPMFLSDMEGRLTFANDSAVRTFRLRLFTRPTMCAALANVMADPEASVSRLLRQSASDQQAREDITTSDALIRMQAHRVGLDLVVWRVDVISQAALSRLTNCATESDVSRVEIGCIPSPSEALSTPTEMLDGLPVPVLKIAVDGTVISANPTARALLSLSDGAIPPLYDLVEGMGRPIAEWLTDAASGRGLHKTEFVRATRPGTELFLQISLGRVEADGEICLIGVLNDATELKSLEAQFVQSQKMQAIGQLAGGVAHDFNNLLTAISGHCDLLLLRHDEGDPDFTDLMQIAQNANRAASLVGQLLAFSRKQNLKPQPLDLRDTMSDLTHLLNRLVGEKITLDLKIATKDKVVRADRRQFEQVIMNLVVNARDAMPSGGVIGIHVESKTLKEALQRDRADLPAGDYVVIEVRDNGTGIASDKLPKIFEPFFTTKKTGEGTGLGLSTAYGIVKQTGGFIFAQSTPGSGSTFSLYFPAHLKSEQVDEIAPVALPRGTAVQGDGIVLLVEDEAPVRAFASRALRMRGYTVLEAENAEVALEILTDSDLKIDVFVTDVIMPGLDGPTWVKQALESRPDTRVVFVSGYAEESLAENQMRVPNSVFLPKPFSLNQLTNVVHNQMQ